MTIWEYAVVDMEPDGTPLTFRLEHHGKEGWELVTVVPKPEGDGACIRYIFKRPKPVEAPPVKEPFRASGW